MKRLHLLSLILVCLAHSADGMSKNKQLKGRKLQTRPPLLYRTAGHSSQDCKSRTDPNGTEGTLKYVNNVSRKLRATTTQLAGNRITADPSVVAFFKAG